MTCTTSDIVNLLIEAEALTENDEVLEDALLNEMGVQSLDKFNVFLLLEERYEVLVPDNDFDKLNSIKSIVDYVNEKTG